MADLEGPEEVVACATCGSTAPLAEARLQWARGVEGPSTRRRVVWTCPACSRSNVRAIEGKLDSQWW
ncbi:MULTISPECIES: hypothetical protein [unclassified Janibacter]|uniref:hypothetical protein n=1 Tax=unclassified Janibacter TaxID=2649294 RepID=UPI003CFE244E